jgi:hypothetical protein
MGKETAMPSVMAKEPIDGVEANVKKLTMEDLNYFKKLTDNTKEIKSFIGELEVSKMRLINDYNAAAAKELDFINQMYAKYNINPEKDFNINPVTGQITVQE